MGTSNSVCALWTGGANENYEILVNPEDQRSRFLPSVVAFKGDRELVGLKA